MKKKKLNTKQSQAEALLQQLSTNEKWKIGSSTQ